MRQCKVCDLTKILGLFPSQVRKGKRYWSYTCKSCTSAKNSARLRERYHSEPGVKERILTYQSLRPEQKRAGRKRDYWKNRARYLSEAARWNKDSGTARRQISRRYKTRRAGWEATGSFSEAEWVSLCERYGHRCLACDRMDRPLTHDHVIPLSRGGGNTIDNIQPLCGPCNSSKGTKTIDYRR